jgi:4-methylaminobutanoate oxidase (formaldehyde-forming)
VQSTEPMMWGSELVLRAGSPAGQVMSAAWGETVGSCVGLAYLWDPSGAPVTVDWIRAGSYEVDIGGDRFPVTVTMKPPFDPAGERIKA